VKRPSLDPTPAELEILQILWRDGPLSVRVVWQALGSRGSYTTVLKLLQIMLEKKLVLRNTSSLSHVYEAAIPQQASQQAMVRRLMDRAFGGSLSDLIVSALEAKPATKAEREAVRRLLAKDATTRKGK
jgi:BlaI family penicillinase repressor